MVTSPLIVDNLPVLTVKDCQQCLIAAFYSHRFQCPLTLLWKGVVFSADPRDVSIADTGPVGATMVAGHHLGPSRSFSQTQDHQVRTFLFCVYPALSRRYYLQSLLLRCQGGCGREPFAIGASLAV
ncbi:hypothetical protein T11_12726 [Trichinella zimbabwensis]|uniref:Uncharacterized protein n=1 Tax=Trichinella zimbabwensis TaxID=268475 RepID=A0A0V1HLP1_9BILA|nr:hypothetical protein T11_12726 [Trichinella zimbabwensis]